MKIETNYSIEDEVWFMHKNKATSGNIIKILISVLPEGICTTYKIKIGHCTNINHKAINLFKTKEDLLKSL